MLDIGLNACSMSTNKCTNVHDEGGGKTYVHIMIKEGGKRKFI
jgi:hypothetical protein